MCSRFDTKQIKSYVAKRTKHLLKLSKYVANEFLSTVSIHHTIELSHFYAMQQISDFMNHLHLKLSQIQT